MWLKLFIKYVQNYGKLFVKHFSYRCYRSYYNQKTL